jgi:signal transduction histidine kinase
MQLSDRGVRRWTRLLWGTTALLLPAALVLFVWGRSQTVGAIALAIFFGLLILGYATVGRLLASRNPRNWIGWAFGIAAVSLSLVVFTGDYVAHSVHVAQLPATGLVAWVGAWCLVPGVVQIPLVFLLFPDGRLPSPRWRPVFWLIVSGAAFATLGYALRPGPINSSDPSIAIANPIGIGSRSAFGALIAIGTLLVLPGIPASILAIVLRFRRSRGEERQQIRWLLYTGIAGSASLAGLAMTNTNGTDFSLIANLFLIAFLLLVAIGMPAACLVAVLKYRLWDLDIVVKKTLVLGAIALFVTAAYVAVLALVGAIVSGAASSTIAFVVGVAVALAFQPLRRWARRFADRLVYGKRATPYEVLAEFSDRMAETYATDDVLPRMAEILRDGTGADSARVWLRVGSELRPVATAGAPDDRPPLPIDGDRLPPISDEDAVEVRHQGEFLGALSVRTSPADPMNPSKHKLVQDLASQAGLVLRNVRLISDLRASRQRLVAAQDEERRKLERNLHDGAQQQLVALAVKLRLAEQLAVRDAEKTKQTLASLGQDTQDALENLRDLARGIYPPLLADKGLPAALEGQARKASIPVEISTDGAGRYPQDTEAAVYFCCLEALQNVQKYANASRAEVRLSQNDGRLTFTVIDDGTGFDTNSTGYGTGLQGMADRLDAIGGTLEVRSRPGEGTTIVGSVPVMTLSG